VDTFLRKEMGLLGSGMLVTFVQRGLVTGQSAFAAAIPKSFFSTGRIWLSSAGPDDAIEARGPEGVKHALGSILQSSVTAEKLM
jgi:hypothetical protein